MELIKTTLPQLDEARPAPVLYTAGSENETGKVAKVMTRGTFFTFIFVDDSGIGLPTSDRSVKCQYVFEIHSRSRLQKIQLL